MKFFLYLFLFPIISYSQIQLSGVVHDPHGSAVMFGTIEIYRNDIREYITETKVDGSYKFLGIPPGNYIVNIQYTGMEPMRNKLQLSENDTSRVVHINLKEPSNIKCGGSTILIQTQSIYPLFNFLQSRK